ncbi:MAG: ABC transporter permease subunit [Nocardioidaceae bacterium]|nr:MAG: ABC transporter permease subunit [Nocardioidaceae bacterium]
MGDPDFWAAVGTTFRDVLIAMVIVIIVGICVGVAMGLWNVVDWLLEPTSQFLRPIPAIVLLPLVLLIYGPTSQLAIALAVLGGIWPVLIHAQIGVRSVDPVAIDTGRAMGLPWRMRQTAIVLPSAMPSFATGIRIASSLTLMLTIGAGVLGGSPGLGRAIMLAQQTGDAEAVFAILLGRGAGSCTERRPDRGREAIVARTQGGGFMSRTLRIVLGAAPPVVVLVGYALWAQGASNAYFPPLGDIVQRFRELWLSEGFLTHVVPSLKNLVLGFAIAVASGLLVGVALGLSRTTREMFVPLLNFGRSLPPIMLIPPLVLVLGVGDASKIAIIAFGAAFPVCLASIDGVRRTDPAQLDMARSIGLSPLETVRHIHLPSASPTIFGGVQVSLQVAFVLMIASEMLAAFRGLGYITMQAQLMFDARTMWAGTILLAILGFLTNALFAMVRRSALSWHSGMTRALSD